MVFNITCLSGFHPLINHSLHGTETLKVKAPMEPVKEGDQVVGYSPLNDGRMYYDDIPHGLCVLWGIAEILSVPVPNIQRLIVENQVMMGKEYLLAGSKGSNGAFLKGKDWGECPAPQNFGVTSRDGLAEFLVWDRLEERATEGTARNARLSTHSLPKSKL
jgi:hypothetical protein